MLDADRIKERCGDADELAISDGMNGIGAIDSCNDVELADRVILTVLSKHLDAVILLIKGSETSICQSQIIAGLYTHL